MPALRGGKKVFEKNQGNRLSLTGFFCTVCFRLALGIALATEQVIHIFADCCLQVACFVFYLFFQVYSGRQVWLYGMPQVYQAAFFLYPILPQTFFSGATRKRIFPASWKAIPAWNEKEEFLTTVKKTAFWI
ncbi:MAG: hypothetical protein HY392_04885 [Candidatus Diapherotrites archaeon]|nr:hypothetical protein [Candidatus Diapherotrites archaeon]